MNSFCILFSKSGDKIYFYKFKHLLFFFGIKGNCNIYVFYVEFSNKFDA